MAPGYRRAVERGALVVNEHACYTVIAGLRAAIQGVPFMPIAGMFGSDLLAARGFRTVADPYTGQDGRRGAGAPPDVAIVHVQEADEEGNARIVGTRFEDVLMAQAARRVIVTAERIVDGAAFEAAPETVAIPGFLVDAVVEAPRGAWPCSCAGEYDFDAEYLAAYVAASKDETALRRFVEERMLATAAPLRRMTAAVALRSAGDDGGRAGAAAAGRRNRVPRRRLAAADGRDPPRQAAARAGPRLPQHHRQRRPGAGGAAGLDGRSRACCGVRARW